MISSYIIIIQVAFLLDIILGDPLYLPHPIRLMGKAIIWAESFFRKRPFNLITNGILFSVSLIIATYLVTYLLLLIAEQINPVCKYGLEIVLLFYSISANSLAKEAIGVYNAIKDNNMLQAKLRLKMIVGRDVDNLSDSDVSRATVETIAENLSDGVIAPLFFALIGGAPLAMTYKMINTLDSMVGYKNTRYLYFGRASARIDDFANYIPARISVLLISLSSQILLKRGGLSFKTAMLEASKHKSPNAGFPEAAFAGALKIRLGGPDYYHGILFFKEYIGKQFGIVRPFHIKKACDLMFLSSFFWMFSLIMIIIFFNLLNIFIT